MIQIKFSENILEQIKQQISNIGIEKCMLYDIMHICKSDIVNKRKVKNILISIRTRTPENAKQVTEK